MIGAEQLGGVGDHPQTPEGHFAAWFKDGLQLEPS